MPVNPQAKFEIRAEDKTAAAIRSSLNRMERFSSQAKTIFGAAAAALASTAIVSKIVDTAKALEEVRRQAEALGTSAESIQELTQTFREFQLDSNDVADALGTLADRAKDAEEGTKSFIDDFALLGVSVDDLRNKRPEELFRLVAERVAEIEDPTRRTAGIVRIFGDDLGRKLNPLLLQGARGLDTYAEKWHALGLIVDEDGVDKTAQASEAIRDMDRAVTSLSLNLTEALAPAISRLAENFNDLITTTELERIARLNDDINRIQGRLVTLADKRATFGAVPQIVAEQERLANLLLDKKNELDAIFERQRERALGSNEAEEAGTAAGAAYVMSFEQEIAKLDIDIPSFGDLPGADRLTPELTADRVFPISDIVDRAYAEVEDKTEQTTEMMRRDFTGLADDVSHSLGSAFSNLFMGVETGFAGMLQRMAADFLGSQLSSVLTDFFGSLFGSGGGGLKPFDLNSIGGRLPGFQHGGSFTVSGAGGPDSQLVAFRATPGEKVTVGHQTSPAGATIIEQHFHVQAGLPPQWEAQLGVVTQIAATAAKESVGRELGGRR